MPLNKETKTYIQGTTGCQKKHVNKALPHLTKGVKEVLWPVENDGLINFNDMSTCTELFSANR